MSNVATRVIVGRKTKWLVLVFWLVVVGVLGPLAGKLTGVEKNDAQSWLPGKAESTKVLRRAEGVPVAQHASRRSSSTSAAPAAHRRRPGQGRAPTCPQFAALGESTARSSVRSLPGRPGRRRRSCRSNLGHDGWNKRRQGRRRRC